MINENGTAKRTLLSMRSPATWATMPLPKQKGTRQSYALSRPFAHQWLYSVQPLRFHHTRLPFHSFDAEEFDALVRSFSDVAQTSKLVVTREEGKAVKEMYDPGRLPGLCYDDDGNSFVNTYIPSSVKGYTDQELRKLEPDYAAPFLKLMEHLVPDPTERHHLMRYATTLMSQPGAKILYAPLLVSETQGVGKTTLAHIIGEVLGGQNYAMIQASTIVDGKFQYWGEKQLVVINEIDEGHQTKIYNKLKEVITDPVIYIEKKFQRPYVAPNYVNVIACSNSLRALRVPNHDRRWMIVRAAEELKAKSFWDEFYDWLKHRDGYRKIKQWAKDNVKEHGAVTKSDRAPETAARSEMIAENFSESMRFLIKPFEWMARTNRANCDTIIEDDKVTIDGETIAATKDGVVWRVATYAKKGVELVVLDRNAERAVRDKLYDGKPPAWESRPLAAVRSAALAAGLFVGRDRIFKRVWGHLSRVISTSREIAEMDPHVLAVAAANAKVDAPFEVTLPSGRAVKVAMVEIGVLAEAVRDW